LVQVHKLKSIEHYGTAYIQQYLADARNRHDAITDDPMAALTFFYSKAFNRGRRDSISTNFKNLTLGVLAQYQTLRDIDLGSLDAQLWSAGVNNRHDRRMVYESIGFVRDDLQEYSGNIFNWAVDSILNGRSAEAYTALTGIHAIGDKLATFYLRDVTLLENMEGSIGAEDYGYFQPVDAWVERVAGSLEIIGDNDRGRIWAIKNKIIRACLDADVSPLLFNAGSWLVGAHAYTLLLERL
jgi:hypothetical protein